METFFKAIVATLGLLLVLSGVSYGTFETLETLAPSVAGFHLATSFPVACVFCGLALMHLIGVGYFFSGLPHPWECTWRDKGMGLLLGGTALLFTVTGPLFAHAAPDAYIQSFAQAAGVLYGVVMGAVLLSLFFALASWELAEVLTGAVWEAGYLAGTFARKLSKAS